MDVRLNDELLSVEIFTTLLAAKVLMESWRRNYNTVRPGGPDSCCDDYYFNYYMVKRKQAWAGSGRIK
jgi:hypothetical protein